MSPPSAADPHLAAALRAEPEYHYEFEQIPFHESSSQKQFDVAADNEPQGGEICILSRKCNNYS